MAQITILSSVHNVPHCKSIVQSGDARVMVPVRFDRFYDVEFREVDGIGNLSALLMNLEHEQYKCIVRGTLRDRSQTQGILRRYAGFSDPFEGQECEWICIDIDDLDLPVDLPDVNDRPEQIALYASQQLPDEFQGVDFHWQFSNGMGVKPGIRIHLWFWLNRPISDQEAKIWCAGADADIDMSMYDPVHIHYTAAPITEPPATDPVRVRSGLYEYGQSKTAVEVPQDLKRLSERAPAAPRTQSGQRTTNGQGQEILFGEDGLVSDGRERLLYEISRDVARDLMVGGNIPTVEEIANKTWEEFQARADLSRGGRSYEEALEKATYRHQEILDGRLRPGRSLLTTLYPVQEPYYSINAVPKEEGRNRLDAYLDDFLSSVANPVADQRIMALRITMGAGKTSATVAKLKDLLATNPHLNIEFYVPRHDLIDEVVADFEGLNPEIKLVHVKGRSQTGDDGSPLCVRYPYVESLEQAGLSVRSNACWRSADQKCEHFDTCAYFKQFLPDNDKSGAVRILPHAYLGHQRFSELPDPDLIVIDEAFLSSIHEEQRIPEPRLRRILNQASGDRLGSEIVDTLYDKTPLLTHLRERGFDHQALSSVELDTQSGVGFNGTMNQTREFADSAGSTETFTAASILETLVEELALENRENVERLRYDPRTDEIVLNRMNMTGIDLQAHFLLLDATADYSILKKLFGEHEFHRIDFEQKAFVTQVWDKTGSNSSWNDNETTVDDLISVLSTYGEIGYKALCVAHKALADRLRDMDLHENVDVAHFGDIRGIDAFKEHDTVFITGRNQPPQKAIDGQARALRWDDSEPLSHDEKALFGAANDAQFPIELRGYPTADPDIGSGVYVRSFSDPRIEAIHQQVREAETIQAIARLRMVHIDRPKNVFLLGNHPVEIPINRLMSWNELMPNRAERMLIEKGNVPLSPAGWMKMRPDLAPTQHRAENLNEDHGIQNQSAVLEASPLHVRLNCWVVEFRQAADGQPRGHRRTHMFRSETTIVDRETDFAIGQVRLDEWKAYLEDGDPEIEGSGWGPIHIDSCKPIQTPGSVLVYPEEDLAAAIQ
jgi:hypothetical protein